MVRTVDQDKEPRLTTRRCSLRAFPSLATSLLLVCAALVAGATPAAADDWPAFRGPRADGTSAETGWKADWGEAGPKIAWRMNVGVGASSVTVVGKHVLTIGNRNDRDIVWCLNAEDGEVIWKHDYPCKFEKRQFEGGTASTPTVDGDRVYVFSYDGQLSCLQLKDGSPVWKKHVVKDLGGQAPPWKYAGSPTIEGEMLLLDIGGNGSSTVALNKNTGEKIWGSGSDKAGYATAVVFDQGKVRVALVFKGKAMVALNAADGKELWRIPWETAYDVNASSPLVLKEGIFISSGYPGGRGALYRLGADGPKRLWLNDKIKTKTSSCAAHDGHVYGVTEAGGRLMCMRLSDGQTAWSQDGFGMGTLMIAGGKLIVLSESGELVIAEATGEAFRPIARAKVLNGRCWVNPVLANGRIYCKSNMGELVCVDVRP